MAEDMFNEIIKEEKDIPLECIDQGRKVMVVVEKEMIKDIIKGEFKDLREEVGREIRSIKEFLIGDFGKKGIEERILEEFDKRLAEFKKETEKKILDTKKECDENLNKHIDNHKWFVGIIIVGTGTTFGIIELILRHAAK